MPSEALWKRAAHELQSPILSAVAGMTPFSSQSYPSTAMLVYSLLYLVVAVAWAVWGFQKRDL